MNDYVDDDESMDDIGDDIEYYDGDEEQAGCVCYCVCAYDGDSLP